jgi:hypothetical protein
VEDFVEREREKEREEKKIKADGKAIPRTHR